MGVWCAFGYIIDQWMMTTTERRVAPRFFIRGLNPAAIIFKVVHWACHSLKEVKLLVRVKAISKRVKM